MKKILNLQNSIVKFNITELIVIVLYSIINISNKGFGLEDNKSLVVFIVLFLTNFLAYKLKYFNSENFFIGLKAIMFFVGSYMAFNQVDAMRFFYLSYTVLILFEFLILKLPKNQKRDFKISILGIVLFILAVFLNVNKTTNKWEIFISIAVIITSIYSFYILFSDDKYLVVSKLTMQTNLLKEASKTNDELRSSQNKFKRIHDEMTKQKFELEVANKKLNRMTSEIYTQNELLRYISSVLDINELLDVVTDAIMGTIGVDTCSLVLFDEQNEKYLYSVKSNHHGDHLVTLKSSVEAGLLQEYFDKDKIHINNRVVPRKYPVIVDRPVGSIAIIPLLRDHLTYGLLVAEHTNIDMFTENNVQFFTGIATQITIAINNANIYALMEDMAIKDGLTGIYNRKYLIDEIDTLISEAKSSDSPISVALFDIDYFKSVNDKYGHLFGDEAIKMAAFMTQRQAKENNGLAIRYGGEEFVLVLPNCNLEKAEQIVKKLHEDIKNEVLIYNDEDVFIDVSLGISSYPEVASHGSELLLRADNAMYYSKEHGRGKITLDNKNLEKVV